MVFRVDVCGNGVEDLPGCFLLPWGDGAIFYQCLDYLSIFNLEHHFELFPVHFVVSSSSVLMSRASRK